MTPTRKPTLADSAPAGRLKAAAEGLAARLQARAVAREERPAARALLARAFDAVEAGREDDALAEAIEAWLPAPEPPPLALACWPLATRLGLRWGSAPQRPRPITIVRIRGALDATLLARFEWRWALQGEILGRVQRVLDTFRTPIEPVVEAANRPSRLADEHLDFSLPEG
ncbi:MAG: hypothetical protein H6706_08775 [Myxococcales bacterium]|nr:hypothetical protein [Myxococcales bacterium]